MQTGGYETQQLIENEDLLKQLNEMREAGMYVSEIAKELSKKTGTKVTQMAIWRALDTASNTQADQIAEYEFPSLEDYAYIFNAKTQKEKNSTLLQYEGVTIRRDLMLRILNKYYKTEFTYYDVRRDLKDRDNEENFAAHWNYLLKNHYIEKVDNYKFKFCDRVRSWKTFNKIKN